MDTKAYSLYIVLEHDGTDQISGRIVVPLNSLLDSSEFSAAPHRTRKLQLDEHFSYRYKYELMRKNDLWINCEKFQLHRTNPSVYNCIIFYRTI